MSSLFASPAMLWWTAAAAVPVVIHLLSRRRYDRVRWAAMEFLLRAFKKTRRRLRVENLLLLLLRVVLLLLLGLALADPKVASSAIFGDERSGSRAAILVMDTSFSMDLRDGADNSPFLKAQAAARRVLNQLRSDADSAALVHSGAPAHLSVPLSGEITRVLNALDALQVSHSGTDLLGALKIVGGILAAPETSRDHPGPKDVYVFTDLQRRQFLTTLGESGDTTSGVAPIEGADPVLDRLLRDIRERGGRVVFVDTSLSDEQRPANVAITSIQSLGKTLVSGQRAVFEVRVRNFGDQTANGEVLFAVDNEDSFAQKQPVTGLKGRSTGTGAECEQSLLFTHEFNDSGFHHVTVRWVDDFLKTDNVRRFAFLVRDFVRVLCVSGSNHREANESSTFFAARALNPAAGSLSTSGGSAFRVTEMNTIEFAAADLEAYDMILMADVPALAPQRLQLLEKFVDAGGSLVFFPGPSFEAAERLGESGSINSLFHKNGKGLLPLRFMRVQGSDDRSAEPWFMQFDNVDHPATAYFKDEKIQPALTRLPINKFIEVEVPENQSAKILTSFRRGHAEKSGTSFPAMIESSFGKGAVVVFTTTADATWNLFGTSPAFVPLIRELAYALVRTRARNNILIGESVTERFEPDVTRVEVQRGRELPQDRSLSTAPDRSAAELTLNRLDTAEIITFKVKESAENSASATDRRIRKVAVNIDTEESDIEKADHNWLISLFGNELLQIVKDPEDLSSGGTGEQESGLWRQVLYAMIVLLFLETVFAQRFSRAERLENAA